jgi:hypothetical protein
MAPEGVAMAYVLGAVERAMKVRDVILQVSRSQTPSRIRDCDVNTLVVNV